MSRRALLILFAAFTAVIALIIFPMRVAVGLFGLEQQGLAAREAWGSVWDGAFMDAQAGALPIGTVRAAVDPLSLLLGRADVNVNGGIGAGKLVVRSGGLGMRDATGQVPLNGAFNPLPVAALAFDRASIGFSNGRCDRAEGRVRVVFSGDVGGLTLAQGLSGVPRCQGERLVLPMISASSMERMTLRIAANGEYVGEFVVKPGDPTVALKLSAAGFTLTQGGLIKRFTGSF